MPSTTTALALLLLPVFTTAIQQPTSPANLFLAHLDVDQHPLLRPDAHLPAPLPYASPSSSSSSSSASCLTTKSGPPITITSGVTDPTTTIRTYAFTTQHQTLIHACSALPSGPLQTPQTTTQILHLTVSYAPEASRTPSEETTHVTNTWAQYPASASVFARSTRQLNTRCECPARSAEEGWTPDGRCVERGLRTGCAVQCGFFRERFTCLVGSDNPREFFEGRVCFGDGELEYLGEPCHVGDAMMHCDECE